MKHYKTVLIDFDGTLLDTSTMPQYSANVRQYKRYSNRIGGKDATGHQEWKKGGNPILFQHALKQLNIPSDDVIAFGNEICDAQAASNAGIKAYHCLWGAKDEERDQMLADPDHPSITSPLQIIDILEQTATEIKQ